MTKVFWQMLDQIFVNWWEKFLGPILAIFLCKVVFRQFTKTLDELKQRGQIAKDDRHFLELRFWFDAHHSIVGRGHGSQSLVRWNAPLERLILRKYASSFDYSIENLTNLPKLIVFDYWLFPLRRRRFRSTASRLSAIPSPSVIQNEASENVEILPKGFRYKMKEIMHSK